MGGILQFVRKYIKIEEKGGEKNPEEKKAQIRKSVVLH